MISKNNLKIDPINILHYLAEHDRKYLRGFASLLDKVRKNMLKHIDINNIKVIGNRIAVKKHDDEKETKGGILIANNSQDKVVLAQVIAVGEGDTSKENLKPINNIKVGDKIVLQHWNGTSISTTEGDIIIVNVSDVLAVIS